MKRRRAFVLSAAAILFFMAGCGLWLWAARQQYARDRQLISALIHNDLSRAKALTRAGADPNTPFDEAPPPTLPEMLRQLFHRPAQENDRLTAFLLACGTGANLQDGGLSKQKQSTGDTELIQLMLDHGAQVNTRSKLKQTALEGAVYINRLPIVELLLSHEAEVNTRNMAGTAPLHWAAEYGSADMVRLLLQHGSKVNVQNGSGLTPLHFAVWNSVSGDAIPLLLAQGANPNQPDYQGLTPLMFAQQKHRPDLVALFHHVHK